MAAMALTAVVVVAAVLSERFLIGLDTGGLGLVSVFVPVMVGLGLICLLVPTANARRIGWPRLFAQWGPYWACAGVVPLLAISFGSYPLRVAFASVSGALVPMAVVVIGVRIALLVREPSRAVSAALSIAVPAVLAYSAFQWAYSSGALDAAVWQSMADWDRATALAYGVGELSRSSGPYVNPNILGAWGALTFVMAATLMQGRVTRPFVMGAAILTILLSQSRGSFVALVAGGAVVLLMGARTPDGRQDRSGSTRQLMIAGFVTALGLGLAGGLPGVTRIVDGLLSFLPGSALDPNMTGRLELWSAAGALSASYPLGTWGPPEMILGTAVDSDWVRLFLQASIFGVVAVGLMLIGGAALANRSLATGRALAASSIVVGFSMITQTPLGYPPIALYWLLVGFSIVGDPVGAPLASQLAVAGKQTRRPAGRRDPA